MITVRLKDLFCNKKRIDQETEKEAEYEIFSLDELYKLGCFDFGCEGFNYYLDRRIYYSKERNYGR